MLPNTIARKCHLKNFTELDSIGRYFGSCFKSSKDIQVWPPTKETLRQELNVATNALILYTAVKSSMQSDELPELKRLQQLLSQSLIRVLKFMSGSPSLLTAVCKEQNITKLMEKLLGAIKDPIIHFRTLDVLGSIVSVCGLACLLAKLQLENRVFEQMFSLFHEITKLLSKDTLQERLPYKNGQLEERLPEDGSDENFPCVQDFVSTTMCLCSGYAREVRVVYKPWQWLDIICLCKEYMSKQAYSSAMECFETLLNTPLDPEIRSVVLCLFATCYLHQDCFQLALQTCKAALKTHKENHLVYFYLSEVYLTLNQGDLEIETLNLLVKLLNDKHLRSKTMTCDPHLDALVFSVCDVLPTVRLPETLCHFAQRCVELHRYTEASEQYMTLLKLLEEDPECASLGSVQTAYRPIDVQEIIVESAEAMALAKQTEKCLFVVEKFLPVLEANDSIFLAASDILDTDIHGRSLHDSQDSLLSSQLSTKHEHCIDSSEKKLKKLEVAGGICSNSSLQFENLCNSVQRKRQRPCSFLLDDNHRNQQIGSENKLQAGLKNFEDPWLRTSLVVRLLLSKIDVLIPNQGYSDEVLNCLSRAQDLLLNDSTSIFQHSKNSGTHSDISSSPSLKRRRVMSDELPTSSFQSKSLPIGNGQTVTIANHYEVSELWRDMAVKVGERMQKAFVSKSQSVSASNISKLLEQLTPGKV